MLLWALMSTSNINKGVFKGIFRYRRTLKDLNILSVALKDIDARNVDKLRLMVPFQNSTRIYVYILLYIIYK